MKPQGHKNIAFLNRLANTPFHSTFETTLHASFALALALLSTPLHADIDDADSLDFESFHTEDTQQKAEKKQPLFAKKKNKGKTKEASTIYNSQDSAAFLQTQLALYKAMDAQCPNGWVKTQESSSTIKQQRQLSFIFNCL